MFCGEQNYKTYVCTTSLNVDCSEHSTGPGQADRGDKQTDGQTEGLGRKRAMDEAAAEGGGQGGCGAVYSTAAMPHDVAREM